MADAYLANYNMGRLMMQSSPSNPIKWSTEINLPRPVKGEKTMLGISKLAVFFRNKACLA